MADVAGVAVEVEDGGHLLALLPGLLDQEQMQLCPVPADNIVVTIVTL